MTGRWRAYGGIQQVPLPAGVDGALWLCGFSVIGPDPAALLDAVGARVAVCLLEREEIERRFPEYGSWLLAPSPHRALWAEVPDHGIVADHRAGQLSGQVAGELLAGEGVVVHCGAGLGRAGSLAALVLGRLGVPADEALSTVRRHRPGAGPQSPDQFDQVLRLAPRN